MHRTNLERTVQRALTISLGLTFVMSTVAMADPMQLDLASDKPTISVTAQQLQGQTSTTINNGGTGLAVTSGTNLTPAQFVALTQVLAGGPTAQALTLDSAGRATGGTFNVSNIATQLSTLNIPSNVIAVANQQSALNIAGNLTTAGTLFGYGIGGSTVNIQAQSVNVLSNGAITTQIPTALQALFTSTGPVGLNLTSTLGAIVNSGSITASGVLNLVSAAGVINNTNAIISGAMGTNILAGSGIINNAGNITSALGNINLATLPGRDLIINNIAGNITAALGSINVRDAAFCSPALTTIIGGNLAAPEINLFGGSGMLSANVDSLLGTVNVKSQGAHISSLYGDLNIGTFDLSGDPLLAALGGNLMVGGAQTSYVQTVGASVVLLAREDVIIQPGLNIITADNSANGNGGNVVIAAGFDIQLIDPTPLLPSSGDETYVILGPSAAGGNITAPGTRINTFGQFNGGAVQLSAHAGFLHNGVVDIGSNFSSGVVIKTYGQVGQGGGINVAAQSAILIPTFAGAINTGTDPLRTGYQDLQVAVPVANGVSFFADGSLLTGFFSASPLVPPPNNPNTNPNPNNPLINLPPPPPPPNFNFGSAAANSGTPNGSFNPGGTGGVILGTDSHNIGVGINNAGSGFFNNGGNPGPANGGTLAFSPPGTGGPAAGTGGLPNGGTPNGMNNGGATPGNGGMANGPNNGGTPGNGGMANGPNNGGATPGNGGMANGPNNGGATPGNGGMANGDNGANTDGTASNGGIVNGPNGANNGGATGHGPIVKGDGSGGAAKPPHGQKDEQGHNLAANSPESNSGSSSNSRTGSDRSLNVPNTNSLRAVGNVSFSRGETGMIETTHDQLRMTLITRSNQILSGNLGGRGNFMMGSQGTAFTNQNGVVVLHAGRLHADTGPDGGTIIANGHRVAIAPNSAAVVAVGESGKVSVMSVGGEKGCTVDVQGASAISLNPGQVMTITDDLSSDDLIDVTGQTSPVSGGITHFGGKKILKQTLAVDRYLDEELLPAARSMNLGISARGGRNRLLSHVAGTAHKQNPAFEMPRLTFSEKDSAGKNSGTLHLYSSEGTRFQQTGPDTLQLVSGMLMLRAPDITSVNTDNAKITADRGALFAVEQQDGITRVRALSGPGDITITAGEKSISLNPGEEMMIAAHPLKRHDLNPADGIGRRVARHFKFSNGVYGAISDFSIASLIHGDARVRDFISHRDGLFEGILKTAVAVELVTASRGRYSSIPKETASNNQEQTEYAIATVRK